MHPSLFQNRTAEIFLCLLLLFQLFQLFLPGGHFHMASDMDVRQFNRVWFVTLETAKGVFLEFKIYKGCHFQATKGLKLP